MANSEEREGHFLTFWVEISKLDLFEISPKPHRGRFFTAFPRICVFKDRDFSRSLVRVWRFGGGMRNEKSFAWLKEIADRAVGGRWSEWVKGTKPEQQTHR